MRMRALTGENQTEESASNGGNLPRAEILVPVVVRDANEVHITFAGSNESGSSIVAGDINRVTGELWANSTVRDAQTRKIVMSTTYSLKCRPA
jgi:hypothetical protein